MRIAVIILVISSVAAYTQSPNVENCETSGVCGVCTITQQNKTSHFLTCPISEGLDTGLTISCSSNVWKSAIWISDVPFQRSVALVGYTFGEVEIRGRWGTESNFVYTFDPNVAISLLDGITQSIFILVEIDGRTGAVFYGTEAKDAVIELENRCVTRSSLPLEQYTVNEKPYVVLLAAIATVIGTWQRVDYADPVEFVAAVALRAQQMANDLSTQHRAKLDELIELLHRSVDP